MLGCWTDVFGQKQGYLVVVYWHSMKGLGAAKIGRTCNYFTEEHWADGHKVADMDLHGAKVVEEA